VWIEFAILAGVALMLWSTSQGPSPAASSATSSPDGSPASDGSSSADSVLSIANWGGTDFVGTASDYAQSLEVAVQDSLNPIVGGAISSFRLSAFLLLVSSLFSLCRLALRRARLRIQNGNSLKTRKPDSPTSRSHA